MLDLTQLTKLTEELKEAVLEKNVDEIYRLCEENNDFIFSITPIEKPLDNQKIKSFIETHHFATQLVKNEHKIVQDQLFQSIKSRKNLNKYKSVKHAK